jgi:membrane protein YqaA with SNARE-associated domain
VVIGGILLGGLAGWFIAAWWERRLRRQGRFWSGKW